MLFGEIVEPSTRALIEDDLEEYPEYTESVPEWEGSSETPRDINGLLFIETEKIGKLFYSCVLGENKPLSKIKNAGIEVFDIGNKQYVVIFSEKKDFTCGEVTELFDPWIRKAKRTFTITSDSIGNYQNSNFTEKPVSLIRTVSNDPSKSFGYEKLESPNLVSGLGASVLSYCIHLDLKCTLFVLYIDTSPLGSVNMEPLLKLVTKLDIPVKHTEMKISTSSSNLYM
ncbi:hypothetical protein NQ318_002703 [Aromia moschata]|uniref:Proteasome assembly chaperone 1 n=1 Tax=Aromia moschata TaxID=1265417 RepID=A0AAV8Y584_9CUCU|nr:hypothetical protein NQ318_002703 [Aromia moschata]